VVVVATAAAVVVVVVVVVVGSAGVVVVVATAAVVVVSAVWVAPAVGAPTSVATVPEATASVANAVVTPQRRASFVVLMLPFVGQSLGAKGRR
jgi:hypothetical protein